MSDDFCVEEMMRGKPDFKEETELYRKTGHIDNRKCGVCGEKAELGPFCGGPFAYYCFDCHKKFTKIMEAYHNHLALTGFAIYHKRGFYKKPQTLVNKQSEAKL